MAFLPGYLGSSHYGDCYPLGRRVTESWKSAIMAQLFIEKSVLTPETIHREINSVKNNCDMNTISSMMWDLSKILCHFCMESKCLNFMRTADPSWSWLPPPSLPHLDSAHEAVPNSTVPILCWGYFVSLPGIHSFFSPRKLNSQWFCLKTTSV